MIRNGRQIFITLVLFTFCPLWASAQADDAPPPMITDRPSESAASNLVPPGHLQIESGYLYTKDDETGTTTRSHIGPTTFFRLGIHERLELRFAVSGFVSQSVDPGQDAEGFGDGIAGTKIYLTPEREWVPETTLNGGVTLPFGGEEVSTHHLDPFVNILLGKSVTDRVSVLSNLGLAWVTRTVISGGDDTAGFVSDTSGSFTYTLLGLYAVSPTVAAFAEFFGQAPFEIGEDAHSFDGGVTWLVAHNVQLDFVAGTGLTSSAQDLFAGGGLSFRLPN